MFIGYLRGRVGAALFDPVSRQVITGATNVIYVENMDDRIDALRHFDARREALKKNRSCDGPNSCSSGLVKSFRVADELVACSRDSSKSLIEHAISVDPAKLAPKAAPET